MQSPNGVRITRKLTFRTCNACGDVLPDETSKAIRKHIKTMHPTLHRLVIEELKGEKHIGTYSGMTTCLHTGFPPREDEE